MTDLMSDVSTGEALRLVADKRRRTVLQELSGNDTTPVTVDQLVADLAGGEDPVEDRRPIALELRHSHLPRLADAGVIEYDASADTVRYHPHEGVERLLRFVSSTLE